MLTEKEIAAMFAEHRDGATTLDELQGLLTNTLGAQADARPVAIPREMVAYNGYVPPEDGNAGEYYVNGWNDCREEMRKSHPAEAAAPGMSENTWRVSDDDWDSIYGKAHSSFSKHKRAIKGQMLSPADAFDYHLVAAVIALLKERILASAATVAEPLDTNPVTFGRLPQHEHAAMLKAFKASGLEDTRENRLTFIAAQQQVEQDAELDATRTRPAWEAMQARQAKHACTTCKDQGMIGGSCPECRARRIEPDVTDHSGGAIKTVEHAEPGADERAAFEAQALEWGRDLRREANDPAEYLIESTAAAWGGWQARAAHTYQLRRPFTPAEIAEQYDDDGQHIASGLPMDACPCGLCVKIRAAQSGQRAGMAEFSAAADALEAEYLAVANGEKKPAKLALEPMVRAVQALRKAAAPTQQQPKD